MLRNFCKAAVTLFVCMSMALAQSGKVVSVDAERSEMVVKVGETSHTVQAKKAKLLDQNGKAAKLGDFSAGAAVKVTIDEGVVTVVQLEKTEKSKETQSARVVDDPSAFVIA
jgi:hypothetical protein